MKSNNSSGFSSLIGLSLATSPFIMTLLAVYLITELMTELGKTSEEIFRSERLPILNFPDFKPN
jgi:hypothetical protein